MTMYTQKIKILMEGGLGLCNLNVRAGCMEGEYTRTERRRKSLEHRRKRSIKLGL